MLRVPSSTGRPWLAVPVLALLAAAALAQPALRGWSDAVLWELEYEIPETGRQLSNATADPTTTMISLGHSGGDSDNGMVIGAAVGGSIGGLVLLLGGVAVGRLLHKRVQKVNVRYSSNLASLDAAVEEFEARRAMVARDVDAYADIATCDERGTSTSFFDQHANFIADWRGFLNDSRLFLDERYRPCLAARRPTLFLPSATPPSAVQHHAVPASAPAAPATAGALAAPAPNTFGKSSARAGAEPPQRQPEERLAKPPKGTPKPCMPPLEEVEAQLVLYKTLSERLLHLEGILKSLQSQLPGAAKAPVDPRLACSIRTPGSMRGYRHTSREDGELRDYHNDTRQGTHFDQRGERWDDQVEVLPKLRHPLLSRLVLKPYGVLGTSQNERDPQPGSSIDAVIVDPAGWPFIGQANNPGYAGGASGSIYRWLRLDQSGFPAVVHSHFKAARTDEEAETMALFHDYGRGQYVVHAIGPKIVRLLEGVTDLAGVYVNVFAEFCLALGRKDSTVPRVLRVPPISSGIFLQNRSLECHMPQMTAAALSIAFARLPLSMLDMIRTVVIELCVFMPRDMIGYQEAFMPSNAPDSSLFKLSSDWGRVAMHFGDFSWVRSKNSPKDRLERLAAMLQTSAAVFGGGYAVGNAKPIELDLKGLRACTQVLRAPERPNPVPAKEAKQMTIECEEHATVMEVAAARSSGAAKVVAVNAASAFHVGGGVLTGGRHALEETWCMVSTLLPSLLEVSWQALIKERQKQHESHTTALDARHDHMHIPIDGCIVSPEVTLFRDVSGKGYIFQDRTVKLAGVISVAMFNMNTRVSDSPVDAPRDFTEYCRLVKHKFRSMVAAARQMNADVLVCPDIGCGVFENDPNILGTLLGEVLVEANGTFSSVVLTGKAAFARAVKDVVAGRPPQLARPPFFTHGEMPPPTMPGAVPHGEAAFRDMSSLVVNVGDRSEGAILPTAAAGTKTSKASGSALCFGRGSTDIATEPLKKPKGKVAVAPAGSAAVELAAVAAATATATAYVPGAAATPAARKEIGNGSAGLAASQHASDAAAPSTGAGLGTS